MWKRKITEIYEGKEVLKNWKFSNFPTLEWIISDKISELDGLLSVRLSYHSFDLNSMQQFNIETKNFITNFTTHNWLDLFLTQYNKKTKTKMSYSPYSNPGYNVFVNLLIWYFEAFGKRPNINFKNLDIKWWNENKRKRDIPLFNFLDGIRWDSWLYCYINNKELFKEDNKWIIRPILPDSKGNSDYSERIWFHWDKTIMNLENYHVWFNRDPNEKPNMARIIVENDLIPLYLQAYIDTNRNVCWPDVATNLKKIYEMIFYVLENKSEDKEKLVMEARDKTPLSSE